MSDLKLTIDQLKNYLGTGLKLKGENGCYTLIGINSPFKTNDKTYLTGELRFENTTRIGSHVFNLTGVNNPLTPICYRLSDLDKFIPELGFVPLEILDKWNNLGIKEAFKETGLQNDEYDLLNHWVVLSLFKWHFWPFGDEYFEAGLVIDKLK